MKAVVCPKYGPPEVLQLTERPKPTPKDHEVLIRVHATSVTAGDCRIRAFDVPPSFRLIGRFALGFTGPRSEIIGMELSGEVVETGKRVRRFQPGDEVYVSTADHRLGAYASYVCFPEKGVIARKPLNLSHEQAATVPVGARTALYFLKEANLKPGQQILINGASGSVGTYAVQLAKYLGANVTAVCSTRNMDLVRSLGADQVIDYTREDFTENGQTYDVVFDAVGKADPKRAIASVAEGGVFAHSVATPGLTLRVKRLLLGSDKRFVGAGPPKTFEDLEYLTTLIEQGAVKPVIDRTWSLDEIADAHRYVAQGHKQGNVAIIV